jgi:hypothetical protein
MNGTKYIFYLHIRKKVTSSEGNIHSETQEMSPPFMESEGF